MEVGGQCHAPAALPVGMTWYPLYRRLGGHQGWSGGVQKISPPSGFEPCTIQAIANCYTNYAIPAHKIICILNTILSQFNSVHPFR
jgi:hypothetical protein